MKNLPSVERSTRERILEFLQIIKEDPYHLPCKTLTGDLKGALSLRINNKDRLVYQVLEEEKIVKVILLLTHYRD